MYNIVFNQNFTNGTILNLFSEQIWVVDMFLKLEGEIVSAKALKKLNLEKISIEINKLIEALPEEETRRGKP